MLSKDEVTQKQKTKRQAKLLKHVANTLSTVMNNLDLSASASNIDYEVKVGNDLNGRSDQCPEEGTYNSLSTQVTCSPTAHTLTNAENNLPISNAVHERKASADQHNNKECDKSADLSTKKKDIAISSSDMRETSWVIPDDAATLMVAFSDTDVESSKNSDYKHKKNSPEKHKLLSRYSQDSDTSDSNEVAYPVQSKPHISNIVKPAEQYFDRWYTDHSRNRHNRVAHEKNKVSKQKMANRHSTSYKATRMNNFEPKQVSRHHRSRHRQREHYAVNDSSSDSENDLRFTTIVKRPQISSSEDEYKDYTKHRHKNKNVYISQNYIDSELECSDVSTVSEYSERKPKTIGYLVRKPLAKLCMTDAGVVVSPEKNSQSRNYESSHHKMHVQNNHKNCYYGGEGDHDVRRKSMNQTFRSRSTARRHMKQSKEPSPIILTNRCYTSKETENSNSPVYVVRSHVNSKTTHPRKATKAWMSERRSDKGHYSAIDKALCDINRCLQKESKKSEKIITRRRNKGF